MNRLRDHRYAEAIAEAYDRLTGQMRDRLAGVDFLCGTDPLFAGLHAYPTTLDGRSLRNTAHCSYTFLSSDGQATIVLPEPEEPWVIVHELGHALDERLGFAHDAVPITPYARTNREEAFAEAFVGWRYVYGDQDAWHADLATRALFEGLAA